MTTTQRQQDGEREREREERIIELELDVWRRVQVPYSLGRLGKYREDAERNGGLES